MLPARLGKSAEALGDAVRMASDFAQRVDIVERWVGSMLESGTQDCAIGLSSRMMVAAGGRARIKDCVAKSGLSQSVPAPVCDASRNGTKAVRTHHPGSTGRWRLVAIPRAVEPLVRYLRNDLKAARTSSENSFGSSQAAKCPPRSTSLK
ncbi:hypothetical protein ABIF86_000883 [Bradyrhizobium japonicum]